MKYFVITLRKDENGNYIYPVNYQRDIGRHNKGHIYYSEVEGETKLLLSIDDKNAVNVVREYVQEITSVEAKAISEKYEERKEEITDEAKIRRIEIKVNRGLALTSEEEQALNPNNRKVAGFAKKEILADKIDKWQKAVAK